MEAAGYERDGEGFTVEMPDGTRRFEATPHEATPALRRSQMLAAQLNATRRN